MSDHDDDDRLGQSIARAFAGQPTTPPPHLEHALIALASRPARHHFLSASLATLVAVLLVFALVRPFEPPPEVTTREIAVATPGDPSPPKPVELSVSLATDPPGAVVYLDGKQIGASPVRVSVGRGRHTFRIERAGYRAIERAFELSDKDLELGVALERDAAPTGTLDLTTTPPAQVTLDGKRTGDTPLHVQLPVGDHTLDVVWSNGKRSHASFVIRAGKTTTLAFSL